MESYVYERPTALPAAVVAPLSAVRAALTVGLPVPQAHPIQDQAELMLNAVVPTGIEGTSGFTGKGFATTAMKRRLDARGVPPRGRPV
ncbi:hypothetical protein O7606_24835 [Micromonospora sp. WMMD882]|uniref:hypothetical protein n=1 Tax=Micromonospora sp. WMMD882 TaxID=3015151 RepID=UPI00248B5A04|nr:hypothetical protein [Micromonospora sp. WMMD882]WBB79353.1 hypothetical protein O7606_24835 [Micromonospora sp. WMMD882]